MRRCSMKGNITVRFARCIAYSNSAASPANAAINLTRPPYQKPELLATAANQLWSWDINKLLGPAQWTYFYPYVILDF